jgi:hypothetical protein
MQTKTRFDRLPKRDREEVLRIDGLQSSRAASPVDEAATTLRRLREHRQKLQGRTSSSLLASSLHQLKSYFCDRGIIDRFLSIQPRAWGFSCESPEERNTQADTIVPTSST